MSYNFKMRKTRFLRQFGLAMLLLAATGCREQPTDLDWFVGTERRPLTHLRDEKVGPLVTKGSFHSIRWHAKDVSPANWVHNLFYSDPKKVTDCDLAYLYIGSGGLGAIRDHILEPIASEMSTATGCWSAAIDKVPNQPLSFFEEPPVYEDGLIARSFKQYFATGDPTWIANFAMVKSVILAMDQLEALYEQRTGKKLRGFILSGKSKRGWTAWLTAATDARVKGVIPIAIDILEMKKMLLDQRARYGSWSPSLESYLKLGLLDRIDKPEFDKLMELVDPFSYRQRLALPKLIISAANDPFFIPDAAKFSFESLPGEKLLVTVPNVDHHIEEKQGYYLPTVVNFVRTLGRQQILPQLQVSTDLNSSWIHSTLPISSAVLHQAYSPKAPDFRDRKRTKFVAVPLAPLNGKVTLPPQDKPGWYAWFLETNVLGQDNRLSRLSSRVYLKQTQP